MATQVRIDSFEVDEAGVRIGYSQGDFPLPSNVSGNGVNYGSVEDFVAALGNTETALQDQLLNIVMAKQFKLDPTLSAPEDFVGKIGVMDLTTPSAPISFG